MKKNIYVAKSVIRKGSTYLLLKRSPNALNFPTLWDFPGGKIDSGETPNEAVLRETKEETSLDIVPGPEIKKAIYEDEARILTMHYFTPESFVGDIELSPEHTEYTWVTQREMYTLELHPAITEFFK